MYEENSTPTLRRILWLAVWFIVIAVVLWMVIWLVFFRHPQAKKPVAKPNPVAQPVQPSPAGNAGSSAGSVGTTGGNGSSPAPVSPGATSPSTAAQPTQLANTGAGDVLLPAVVATALGGAGYYIRIRKKLAA